MLVFTSQPLAGFMSQSAKPVAQAPIAQTPDPQVAPALAKRHTTPQPPQLFTSAARTAVSQPLAAMPSQSEKPAAQPPMTHAPAAQALTLALARRHWLPHTPQLAGSVPVFTHAPEQLVVPAPHEVPQVPIEQT